MNGEQGAALVAENEKRSSIELARNAKGERNREVIRLATTPPGMTLEALGVHFGITKQAIALILKKHGVTDRPRPKPKAHGFQSGENHWNWRGTSVSANGGRQRAEALMPSLGICEGCGDRPAIDRHHLDHNTSNNEPSNLRQLCRSCHNKTHGRVPPRPDPDVIRQRMTGRIPWNKGAGHAATVS